MTTLQRVDLFQQPLEHVRVGSPPLTLNVVVTPNTLEMQGGVPGSTRRGETYVLLSALPEELRQRVILAIQVLSGI